MTLVHEKNGHGLIGKREPAILPFAPNRVLRLYLGGSGIDRLCGIEPAEDSRYPENWIASCIEGNGRAYHSPGHGISKIRLGDSLVSFPEYRREEERGVMVVKRKEPAGIVCRAEERGNE